MMIVARSGIKAKREFELVIEGEGERRRCRVARRMEGEVGVQFLGASSMTATLRAKP